MQRNPIAKFRIHASQPCLYHSRRIVLAQSARQLKSKSQTGLGITVDVAASNPSVHCSGILHPTDIGGELAPDDLHQLLYHSRCREPERLVMGERIRSWKRCGLHRQASLFKLHLSIASSIHKSHSITPPSQK